MKYIDADKLIAEIERLNSLVSYDAEDRHDEGLHALNLCGISKTIEI